MGKALLRMGFEVIRQKGSPVSYRHSKSDDTLTDTLTSVNTLITKPGPLFSRQDPQTPDPLNLPLNLHGAFSHRTEAFGRNAATDVTAKLKSALRNAARNFFGGEHPPVPE